MAGRDPSPLNCWDSGVRKDASVEYSAIEHNVDSEAVCKLQELVVT